MILLLICAYTAYGLFLARRMGWTDGEAGLLPAGYPQFRAMYQASWGVPLPLGQARVAWRLPGAYWLYAWAPRVPERWQRGLARAFSLALSLPGVGITLLWAQELGGTPATVGVGLMLLSSATLVGSYATASYEGLVASLWMLGLWAAFHDAWWISLLCGLALGLLRHTSYWQAVVLLMVTPFGLPVVIALAVWIAWRYPGVTLPGFAGSPPPYYPRDGWSRGLRVFAQRYEPFAGWLGLALIGHALPRVCLWLLAFTLGTLVVTHLQRTLWRPKWVVGYLPDFALPVVLVLGVAMAPALADLAWWFYAALFTVWGLARRRHPALA